MTKKRRGKKRADKKNNITGNLKDETKHSILAVAFFMLSAFFILSAWGKSGVVGSVIFSLLDALMGLGFVILPLLFILLGVSFYKSTKPELALSKYIGAIIFFLSGMGLITVLIKNNAGGILGNIIAMPLLKLFDIYTSFIILLALIIISGLLIFDTKLSFRIPSFLAREEKDSSGYDEEDEEYDDDESEEEEDDDEKDYKSPDEEETNEPKKAMSRASKFFGKNTTKEEGAGMPETTSFFSRAPYILPPLSLLAGDKGKPGVGDIKANANIIKRTLANFGITVEMDEITVGPSVTRYALKPAEGVKLSRIVGLQNDLGLALAAHPLRIEAPIPGKSLVGIEVPNTTRSTIGLSGLIASNEYQESVKPLLFALGKNIAGKSFYADLAKLPHVLIAGATGAGKSVSIHAIITSLLYRNSPEHMRLIMVDPKRVELTLYNNIPHLLTPVITNHKKAILALKWAAKEMDRRYDILETESVRDISSYHKNVVADAYKDIDKLNEEEQSALPETMPYIVIVIDELADMMTSYPRELESAIVRLAQMSRAVGIHLVLSTQRPSVNVITGLIKANIPGRVALQVASQIDSRTILDAGGAEKLLGAGDMLYLSGEMSQPQRLQSAYVTETEVKKVVKFLISQYKDEVPSEINLTPAADKESIFEVMNNEGVSDEDDDMYEDAYETVLSAGKASTSYLQRKLKVGYARAARLMDMLEDRGIIGPADGSKPRDVLIGNKDDDDGYGQTPEERADMQDAE